MGIYIKGMKMPKEGSWKTIRIYPDGTCAAPNWQGDCTLIKGTKAVSVPPHGDLIDLKSPFKAQYYDEMTEEWVEQIVTVEEALYGCMVDKMPPTIIPASESKERPAFLPQYELTPRSEEGE